MESGDKKQRGRPPLGDLTNQSSKDASYTLQVDDLGERTLSLQRIDGVTTQGEGELNGSVLVNETATPGLAGEFQPFRFQAAAATGQHI
ncbi:hypothetical protein C2845_PM05G06260 [Panicum miliaceum]|uniref:Uncharacterized protein n=1 Tax=Panicum miliaceum TaxID=4540 RepID=A0A3L6SXP0_PANMI|nr:hypothetical protein C2845_PM05G06260 [Panicum miliaceum]